MAEYLASVPKERAKDLRSIHAFIKKTVPRLKPYFAYNMLGYGKFKYRNYKNDLIDWPVIALANQKNYLSLYVCSVVDGKYVAEMHKAKLGKPARPDGRSGGVSVGKSCIRFKKSAEVNLPELAKVLKIAARSPGLVA